MKQFEREVKQASLMGNKNLEIIDEGGKRLLITHRSKYTVNGYVFTDDCTVQGKFKQLDIRETKFGERFVMADRTKFSLSNIEELSYSLPTLEKELDDQIRIKKMYEGIQLEDGSDCSVAIENQNYYINNLNKLIADIKF